MSDILMVIAMYLSSLGFVMYAGYRQKMDEYEEWDRHWRKLADDVVEEVTKFFVEHRAALEPTFSMEVVRLNCEVDVKHYRTSEKMLDVGIEYLRFLEESFEPEGGA